VIAVSHETIQKATRRIVSCEHCAKRALTPFSRLLDDVLGFRSPVAYLAAQARCPQCKAPINESTFIEIAALPRKKIGRPLKEFAPPLETTEIILINESVLLEAQALIATCERCDDQAEIAFDYLLDAITGSDPTTTEYLLPKPARCPQCLSAVSEKTLITS